MSDLVIDASAVLAAIMREPGHEIVDAEVDRCIIGSVNLAEVVAKLLDLGFTADEARQAAQCTRLPAVAFDENLAFSAAELRPLTRHRGLSLGDRACLALARRLGVPVLTADRNWASLDLGISIRTIR